MSARQAENGDNLKKGESAMSCNCVGGLSGIGLRRNVASGFHGQTAQFVSVIAQNLPRIRGELMQEWIQNPQLLQNVLHKVFSGFPPQFDFRMPNIWGIVTIDKGEFDLVITALYEFGSDLVAPTVSVISSCALKNGLELCSSQIARELESGKGYIQPKGEKLFICVDKLDESNNKLYCLESGKLTIIEAEDRDGWNSGFNLHGCEQFVFVRPRK